MEQGLASVVGGTSLGFLQLLISKTRTWLVPIHTARVCPLLMRSRCLSRLSNPYRICM